MNLFTLITIDNIKHYAKTRPAFAAIDLAIIVLVLAGATALVMYI